MPNKLKKIFSNAIPELESTIEFQDAEAKRKFFEALALVESDGSEVPVDGIKSIAICMIDHSVKWPINKSTEVLDARIGPAVETFEFSVVCENREKRYVFKKYQINDGTVLETEKEEVVYLKLFFDKKNKKLKITYQFQYQHAKSISEVCFEIKAFRTFLMKFMRPSNEVVSSEVESTKINEMTKHIKYTESFFEKLMEVETILKQKFSVEKLHNMTPQDQLTIEELHLLLYQKKILRLNRKLGATDDTRIELTGKQEELSIGKKISVGFHGEITYELFGQTFSVYTANVLINAIIKEIHTEGKKTVVIYGDTDTQPMFVAYSAYMSEDEAVEEIRRNLSDDPQYLEAHTLEQYMHEHYAVEMDN